MKKILISLLLVISVLFSFCLVSCNEDEVLKMLEEQANTNHAEYVKTIVASGKNSLMNSSSLLSVVNKASEGSKVTINFPENEGKTISDVELYFAPSKIAAVLSGYADDFQKDVSVGACYENSNLILDFSDIPDETIAKTYKASIDNILNVLFASIGIEEITVPDVIKNFTSIDEYVNSVIEKVVAGSNILVEDREFENGDEKVETIYSCRSLDTEGFYNLLKSIIPEDILPLIKTIAEMASELSDSDISLEDITSVIPDNADGIIELLKQLNLSLTVKDENYLSKETKLPIKETVTLNFGITLPEDASSDMPIDLSNISVVIDVNYPENMSIKNNASFTAKVSLGTMSVEMGVAWKTEDTDEKFTGTLELTLPALLSGIGISDITPVVTYNKSTGDFNFSFDEASSISANIKYTDTTLDITNVKITADGDEETLPVTIKVEDGAEFPTYSNVTELTTSEEIAALISQLGSIG